MGKKEGYERTVQHSTCAKVSSFFIKKLVTIRVGIVKVNQQKLYHS